MIEIKVPSPGESITEVQLASWLVSNGDYVEKDDEFWWRKAKRWRWVP